MCFIPDVLVCVDDSSEVDTNWNYRYKNSLLNLKAQDSISEPSLSSVLWFSCFYCSWQNWVFIENLSKKTQAILMAACVFGDPIDAISSNVFSYQLGYFCTCYLSLFLFLWVCTWRFVSGPSDLLQPQAVINYRHVSLAQTLPSLPPLCDKGHIILTSSRNASAVSVLEVFLIQSKNLCSEDLLWLHKNQRITCLLFFEGMQIARQIL